MVQIVRRIGLSIAGTLLLLASPAIGAAQGVIVTRYGPPAVTYYYPSPVVSYYAAPAVSYYTAPVAYYPAPTVSYYAAPNVSYYPAPAATFYPSAVSRTSYGLFGRPRVTTYYYPAYVIP